MSSNLWRDGQSCTEAVHRLVVLSAEVKENAQTTLQLRVHLGGVRVGRLQVEGLDVSKQRSGSRKTTRNRRVFKCFLGTLNPRVIV